MIRLPSFFKRKTQSDDLEFISRSGPTPKRAAPRSLQRAAEAEELALTEDPEQQRARHRLIGAAVLVLIAVIGLPRILDGKPKPAPNDIAVNIVTSLPILGVETKPQNKPKDQVIADSANDIPKSAATPEVKPDAKTEADAEVKPIVSAANKSGTLGLAVGEEIVATSSKADAKPKADDVAKPAASNGSGKFIIQIGAFASEDRAKGWVAKLKEQKIPYYVSNKTGSDGTKLFLLRAGPYTDKDAAEAAEKKIKAMGLSPRRIESGKQ